MLAYLVIREGSKWSDVFRLIPGQTVIDWPSPHEPHRAQGRTLQPLSRRTVQRRRSVDAPRSRQPQRHGHRRTVDPRRVVADARRRHSHRQLADGLRPRSGQGLSRCQPAVARRPRGPTARLRPRSCSTTRTVRLTSPRRSPIAAGRRNFSNRSMKKGESQQGRAATRLCRLTFELAKAAEPIALARLALEGLFEAIADRCRRTVAHAPRRRQRQFALRPGHRGRGARRGRFAQRHRFALPSRFSFSGGHGPGQGRGRAGAQRDWRQQRQQPRQQGRDPCHQRDLRAGAPRQARLRADPSLLDPLRSRPRSRRPGIHAGRGRDRGRRACRT